MKLIRFGSAFLFFFLFVLENALGQSFIGVANDNDNAAELVNNPAFAVNNDMFQVHVASLSVLAGNTGFIYNTANDFTKASNRVKKAFWMNVDFRGPAVTFKIKKRFNFAVSTRLRYLMNADNVSDDVFKQIDKPATDTAQQYIINNFSFNTQMFSEVNLSYAGYIISNDDNMLTAGASIKVLTGFAAVGLGIPHAVFSDFSNNTIGNVDANAHVAFTPYANQWLSSFTLGNALQNGVYNIGFGLDAGFVYVHTPISEYTGKRDGYDFRAAVSITDVGSINYTASSTTGNYVVNTNAIQLDTIDKSAGTTYGQSLAKYTKDSILKQTESKSKFRVGLPTALHVNMDMKMYSSATVNMWLNANLLVNLRSPSANKYASHYVTTFSLAPRALWANYGIGLPFSFNAYKQGTLGIILYAGPFFIGSSSVGNLLFNNISSADAFAGLSFHIKYHTEDGMRE